MENKEYVPRYPEPSPITGKMLENYDGWINYFRTLSPRIKFLLPTDETFNLEKLKKYAKVAAARDDDPGRLEKVILEDWPAPDQVAFFVAVDMSLPGHAAEFLVRNSFLFCFGNVAFSLDYFEIVSEEVEEGRWEYKDDHYSLEDYPDGALSWAYIRKMIVDRLLEIETKVPPPPEE